MKTQYIVQESDKSKRKDFYDYIVNNYDLKISYPYSKVRFVNDNFPFVVDFKEKRFWKAGNNRKNRQKIFALDLYFTPVGRWNNMQKSYFKRLYF